MATRRAFLASLAAISLPRLSWADVGSPAYLAAGKMAADFVLHGLTATGQSLFRIPLPARGHAAAAHPELPQAVAFARRPGAFALVIDCFTGAVRHQLTPPDGRQFNGHGVFSADGKWLMTSEVVAQGSAGRIGVWNAKTYQRIQEWDSGGIGPHDMKRLADGRFVVANGGIQTDPGDRTKLNIPDMQPNLSLLSPDGTLLDQVRLDPALHQNSIRHLALIGDTIAFAMQWEGDPAEAVPQLGLWTPGSAPRLCPPPDAQAMGMMGYAGSIAATADRVALTSPKGGVLMIFDAEGRYITTLSRPDLSGVAAGTAGFVATDGQGAVWAAGDTALTLLSRNATLWDNHLIAL